MKQVPFSTNPLPYLDLFTYPAIMHVFSLHPCFLASANAEPTYWLILSILSQPLFHLLHVPCMDACVFIHIPRVV